MTFVKGLKRAETAQETIERLTLPLATSECWAWLGHHHVGYAMMRHGLNEQRRMVRVSRFLMNAPKGMDVDHLCHNPWCVNPNHLEVVTHLENIRRHAAWVIANRLFCETCSEQLKYEGKIRVCRKCKREYHKRWKAKKREEQGLPPVAPYRGQRKFKCDVCGSVYEILARPPSRGPRYGCRACQHEYKNKLYARTRGKKLPQDNLLKTGGNLASESLI